MTDFLLELRSEEIPARMQAKAREDLARLFQAEMHARSEFVELDPITYATPRRLTLISRNLPDRTDTVSVEVKGPKTSAPPQALEGFLRKTGLVREQLVERDGVFFAITETPGRSMVDVLAEVIPAVIRAFPWPKSMRWGAASLSTESLRWVRPLQGIVALFGEDVVPVEIAGVASGAATVGHRFHHPGVITIGSAHDYVEKLRACHVIVDQDERESIIALGATQLAAEAGLDLVRDEGLLAENAGLTEWPVPLLGRFDAAFLDVPPEVIQLTARVNQKYFVCRDAAGKLANAFVCTANIDATDGGAKIVEGNRKVLAARLSDARFFYDTDRKVPLEDQLTKLDKIVFHEKLGTVADKVDRVAKLARWLVEAGIVHFSPLRGEGDHAQHGGGGAPQATSPAEHPHHHAASGELGVQLPPAIKARAGGTSNPKLPLPASGEDLAALAERAARLAKADLVTGMVGEFPELQGLMGGYYAAAQGEPQAVADAIRDHYKPVGQGDAVPTEPLTVAVALADKLDTIAAFFLEGMPPTGTRDPFALRRAALGVIALVTRNGLRLPLRRAVNTSTGPLLARSLGAHQRQQVEELIAAREALEGALPEAEKAAIRAQGLADVQDTALITHLYRSVAEPAATAVIDFFADRLKVQQREAGVRHDLIDAVFALGGEDDLVRLLARVQALQAFVGTEDGRNLLAGYKRAANILRKEGYAPGTATIAASSSVTPATVGVSGEGAGQEPRATPASAGVTDGGGAGQEPRATAASAATTDGPKNSLSYTPESAEGTLIAALDSAEPAAARAVAAEDFEAAMAALASLRAPIDAFFDSVTVNDPDAGKRAARLALLARVRAAVHTVADFSRIEG